MDFFSLVAPDRLSNPELSIINFGTKVTTLAQSGRQMKCQRKAPQNNVFLAFPIRNRCNFFNRYDRIAQDSESPLVS